MFIVYIEYAPDLNQRKTYEKPAIEAYISTLIERALVTYPIIPRRLNQKGTIPVQTGEVPQLFSKYFKDHENESGLVLD